MDFSVKSGTISKLTSSCVVVAIFEGRRLGPSARLLDQQADGYLSALVKRGDIQGEIGQSLLVHDVPGTACERILLLGCGKEREISRSRFQRILQTMTTVLLDAQIRDALFTLTEVNIRGLDLHDRVRQTVESVRSRTYRFDQFKSGKKKKKTTLRRVTFLTAERGDSKTVREAIAEGEAIANGMDLARNLGNMPGNVCTPGYLASQARLLGREFKSLKINVLGENEIKRLKMGAFLSVTRGSRQAPKLITITYRGGKSGQAPVVLVGKGITFDSGGVSIKPAAAMDEMKYDMCGAAGVIGTMRTVAELGLPVNVIAVVPSCENMPDGNASKPGDIVTSMSGQTIEILNTDAEGRLILCDALTYAGRFKPDTVIDVATLTGACLIALGKQASGLLTNNSALGKQLKAASETSGDRTWELPLWEEYQELLDSNFADMANVGGRDAGTITAACFLSRFTKDYHWAHLDIAGTAWLSGASKGATGRPVPLLSQYLITKSRA
jgi:leucyl aminopeptidase